MSFAEVKTVNLDEYLGLAPTHEQSYRYFMQSNLFDHIDVKPESVTFTCPHCGREVTVPWRELDVPECWGDDWGYVECPDCETEVKLGDYEYD